MSIPTVQECDATQLNKVLFSPAHKKHLSRKYIKYFYSEMPKVEAVFPNAFIIGVQKAGTTTLDAWLSQHPQIYCYETLKDVHLFARFKNVEEIKKRLQQEPAAYNRQPVVLQSAVNYIFYPSMLESIAHYQPNAKLIVILRNPVDRAFSSYNYFKKMLRETRDAEAALIYEPKTDFEFSRDNNDFTYIEHGLYYQQLKHCMKYFSKEQLLVLHYDDLAKQPEKLLQKLYSFLGVDAGLMPDFSARNITGEVKNITLQKGILKESSLKKWIVTNVVDFWLPVTKRKLLKQRLLELNTGKKKNAEKKDEVLDAQKKGRITAHLRRCYINDVQQLDALLSTDFSKSWLAEGEEAIVVANEKTLLHK